MRTSSDVVGAQGKSAASYTLLVKGAPEAVIERCSQAMMADGSIVKMDDGMRKAIMNKVENEYNSDQEALHVGPDLEMVVHSVVLVSKLLGPICLGI